MHTYKFLLHFLLVGNALINSGMAYGRGVYSQIIATFPQVRSFKYEYFKAEHSLVIAFDKTSAEELSAFERYDDRLIKRVIFKDQSPSGTEVKLVLRDRQVKAMVQAFHEPYRVVVDLFDAEFEISRDPKTGFPLANDQGVASNSASNAGQQNSTGKHKLLVDDEVMPTESTDSSPNGPHSPKRMLLQPLGQPFIRPEDMERSLATIPDGVGKAWKDFPPYIYRIQTAPYEEGGNKNPGDSLPSYAAAMSSSASMAEYAGKLFNLGQESKALVTYLQVLHNEPTIFDKDALSLWKLSEIHLGQGNLTLARGYYESLIEKHPESPLANFARLRILDVTALRLLQKARYNDLPTLLDKLANIKPRHQGELAAQIGIRKAYWDKDGVLTSNNYQKLPNINSATYGILATNYPNVESSRTAFIVASILVSDIVRIDKPWLQSSGPFAEAYFTRFSGAPTEPFRTTLRENLLLKLNKNLQTKVIDGRLVDAISDFEALPPSMKSVKKDPKTSWCLAEAYRKLGDRGKSIEFYTEATKLPAGTIDRFKAEFWLGYTAYSEANKSTATSRKANVDYSKIYRDADRKMSATWSGLSSADRDTISAAYKEHFEKAIVEGAKIRTVAKIVLENWSKNLNTKTTTTGGAATGTSQIDKSYSPSGSAVFLLTDLGKLFGQLGIKKERSEALTLLKTMKPSDFAEDQAAKNVWANQLFNLAEDFRKANQYLDAGRLYSLIGENSENWEKRAETLYKGGLLLFRAGRKQDAINSFQKASDDGNNLFYANLAKERLAQIQ